MDEAPREEELDQAAEVARAMPPDAPVCALALDVLARQGEGRALFAGREYVTARAAEHGATDDGARAGGIDVADVLARGPSTTRERAVVAALAVRGLGDRIAASPDAAPARLERFVRQADFLGAWTPYALWSLVPRVLDEDAARAVWDALVAALVADHAALAAEEPALAARTGARLAALARAADAAALLARVADEATDATVRLLATGFAAGRDDADVAAPTISGTRVAPRRSGVRHAVALLTGVALLVWLARGAAFVVGLRRRTTLVLAATALRATTRTSVLGRPLRERDETWTLAAVAGAARESRWSRLPVATGALALGLGVVLGGLAGLDGIRTGDPGLVVLAALVVVAGAAVDLGLDAVARALRTQVRCEARLANGATIAVDGVALADADRFVKALEAALGRLRRAAPADVTLKDAV